MIIRKLHRPLGSTLITARSGGDPSKANPLFNELISANLRRLGGVKYIPRVRASQPIGSSLAVRVIRLGSPRAPGEGLRLGTVRRPPRGVRKADYAGRNYFDVWLPELAPSAKLVKWALSQPFTKQRWARYARSYRREMHAPDRQRMLQLLARLSFQTNFSVGCYCEREDQCHRSLLRELLAEQGAKIATRKTRP
jgi:uncharacterized protein YeaO (DUF488 family)